jgi:hypothetical protein
MSDPDTAERLAYLLEAWKHLVEVYGVKCRKCADARRHVAIKATPAGSLCIACWLTYEPCHRCRIEAGLYRHGGAKYCSLCLNPELSEYEVAQMILLAANRREGSDIVLHVPHWADY